jgi:hypothetical protein
MNTNKKPYRLERIGELTAAGFAPGCSWSGAMPGFGAYFEAHLA